MSQKKQNPAAPKAAEAETIPDLDQPAGKDQVQDLQKEETPVKDPEVNPTVQPSPKAAEAEGAPVIASGTPNIGRKRAKKEGQSGPPFYGNKDTDRKFPLEYNPGKNVVVRMAEVRKTVGGVSEVENSARIQVFEPSIYSHLKEKGAFKGKKITVINE